MKSNANSDNIQDVLHSKIRDIPDFPKKGIVFKDITTLLNDAEAYNELIRHLKERYQDSRIDFVAGVEARGFLLGSVVAYALGVGFVPIRKTGKLPSKTYASNYQLEYGTDCIEIHADAFRDVDLPKVLLIDDLIATGGTAIAALELIKKAGGDCVESCFLLNLAFLEGKQNLRKHCEVYSVIDVD